MTRKSESRILIWSAGLLASIMIPVLSGCSGGSAAASGPGALTGGGSCPC